MALSVDVRLMHSERRVAALQPKRVSYDPMQPQTDTTTSKEIENDFFEQWIGFAVQASQTGRWTAESNGMTRYLQMLEEQNADLDVERSTARTVLKAYAGL